MTRALVIALFVPLLLADVARGDDAIPRYVAQQGEDRGDCSLPVRPCRTIQYALSVAGKGDQVRVAGGSYQLSDVGDALVVVAGAVDVRGGFDRFDHFLLQSPETNRTSLTGVPVAFRAHLDALGFHVVADRKMIDATASAAIDGFEVTQVGQGAAPCSDNVAGGYPCKDVDLLYHLARSDLSSSPASIADVWGFVDLNTQREYALLGMMNGLAVVDVTDPTAPFEVGTVPGALSGWRDVKVTQRYDVAEDRWNTYAYVSTEYGGRLVVVDLTGLPNHVRLARRSDTSAHNVYVSNVDYTTGVPLDESRAPPVLQVLGSPINSGAARSFDVRDPLSARQVAATGGGYSHDATSMLVDDDRAAACKAKMDVCEVLLDFNETDIEIWDYSEQRAPELLSSTTYDNAGYVHSGWWSEDGRFLFVHDEFDERNADLNTTVRVFDLADLQNPELVHIWTGPTAAIDHNGYVRGNRYYMSTYSRGLTVLDITDPLEPVEVGLFDTHPASDDKYYGGAWGVYPFLPGGSVLISDIRGGLYVVGDRTRSSDHVQVGFASTAFGGEEGEGLSIEVFRRGAGGTVSVDYAVFAGSAGETDLTTSSGTLYWPPSEGHSIDVQSLSVPLLRDDVAEPIERAFVRLSNPAGGAVLADINMAYVFVADPGRGASVGFAETQIAIDETSKRLIATVQRLGSPLGPVSVDYEVGPLSASPGSDYVEVAPGRLSWAHGDATARTIVVPLLEDNDEELAEQFEIRLSSPTGATLADDRLVVDINADGMAVTGFMLFDDATLQDLQPIPQGKRLALDAVVETTGFASKSGIQMTCGAWG
ncbi:MAG: choice-of-anchor B family protein [Gammaproteobacteria bacterium]|nr:choice-of-anchor B family protein [Gammaproteobacteria bacterium]